MPLRQSPEWAEDMETYAERYNDCDAHVDTVKLYGDGVYGQMPIKHVGQIPRYAVMIPWIEGPDVLDAGCNGGAFTKWLHDQGHKMTGLDIVEEYIARNKERFPEIEWVCAAFEEIDWAEHFDTIIASEIIEHVIDPSLFVKTAHGVLRPGAVLVGTVPRVGGLHEPGLWYDEDEHLWSFTQGEVEQLLSTAFADIHVESAAGDQWWAFKARK